MVKNVTALGRQFYNPGPLLQRLGLILPVINYLEIKEAGHHRQKKHQQQNNQDN